MENSPMARSTLALLLASLLLALGGGLAPAQQVGDDEFAPAVSRPAFETGKGPVVFVDEAHFNFHTASGRYAPFKRLLERDGYVVRPSGGKLTKAALAPARVLVIANALAERNSNDWTLPTPSAFDDDEIAAVREWVREGGSLLLIADHMPFAGAAEKLGEAFGVRWSNGFAAEPNGSFGPTPFSRDAGGLRDAAVTRGRSASERVERVVTFTGSAFRAEGATPLLVLPKGSKSAEPKEAWKFDEATPRPDVGGWYQGAVLKLGKGRVAVFGEAAMFTAQLAGPQKTKVGMNSPDAPQNAQFLLNVMHWLTGQIEA
jgi:hypothetical protein